MSGKIVYVLGAGFSKPADFPLQAELFSRLVDKVLNPEFSSSEFISLDIASSISDFLVKSGFVEDGKLTLNITLEDLFTLLDRTIADRTNFVGLSWLEFIDVRARFIRGILGLLHGCAQDHISGQNATYKHFAATLLKRRIDANQEGDPFSIISLNWDSLIEDSIFWVLQNARGIQNGRALADVDYCVYTIPLKNSPHTTSTKQNASGIYNVKLLKMHGSCTWLRCPCSNHLYTGIGSGYSADEIYVKPQASPFIEQHLDDREPASSSVLEPYIITPTFAKVFDLSHIQNTWHNAFVELREAAEVIFIGYSLPDSDYHFRTLLRRAIRRSTPVRVILHTTDEPPGGSTAVHARMAYPYQRYKQLF